MFRPPQFLADPSQTAYISHFSCKKFFAGTPLGARQCKLPLSKVTVCSC